MRSCQTATAGTSVVARLKSGLDALDKSSPRLMPFYGTSQVWIMTRAGECERRSFMINAHVSLPDGIVDDIWALLDLCS